MPIYKRVSETDELVQILNLQRQNLPARLSQKEKENEGFVTVSHTFEILERLNSVCPHVVAKVEERIVGYALCMHPRFANEIAVLKPMFEQIEPILDKQTPYMVMGQICVDKAFRKKGIFRGLYYFYRSELQSKYDCLITSVASSNSRSLFAHKSIGFETIKTFHADSVSWELIKWDLKEA